MESDRVIWFGAPRMFETLLPAEVPPGLLLPAQYAEAGP